MTSSHRNDLSITGHLCRESTAYRPILTQRTINAGLWCLTCNKTEQIVEQTVQLRDLRRAKTLLWRHCNPNVIQSNHYHQPRIALPNTVRCRHLAVTFLQMNHERQGWVMAAFRDFEVWSKFYFRSCALCNSVLYCTGIYWESIVYLNWL